MVLPQLFRTMVTICTLGAASVLISPNTAYADAPPAITLSISGTTAVMRTPFTGYTIHSTGGAISSWSISPQLGNGLNFDTTSGLISGTPTSAEGSTDYTITAHNSAGDASRIFNIFTYGPMIDAQSASPSTAGFGQNLTLHGLNLDLVTNIEIGYTDSVAMFNYSWSTTTFLSQSATSLTFRLPLQSNFQKISTLNHHAHPIDASAPDGVVWDITAFETGLNTQNQSEATTTIYVAPPTPAVESIPDPIQRSTISGITPGNGVAGVDNLVTVKGSFIEKVSAIQVNGQNVAARSWTQTDSALTFMFNPANAGIYSLQIFNGSVPLLAPQIFTVIAAPEAPHPASLHRQRNIYLRCIKGIKTRVVYGFDPRCPAGFSKK